MEKHARNSYKINSREKKTFVISKVTARNRQMHKHYTVKSKWCHNSS